MRPREASGRGSGEWSGPGVARWGGTRVSTTAGVVAARRRGSGVLTGPVSRDSRKFVQLGFVLFAVGPLVVPPAEEEEDQEMPMIVTLDTPLPKEAQLNWSEELESRL